MNIQELRKKNTNQLSELLNETRERVRELGFKMVTRQLKDVRTLRKSKRDIARIMTVQNEKKKGTEAK